MIENEKDRVSVQHMLNHAQEAVGLLKSQNRESLSRDRVLNLAVVRLIEIVGEAANRISPETREQLPQIPWRQIIGMRNRLIHGYDFVDFDILWQTVKVELPTLIDQLEKIIATD